jgi:serine/threonine protein kinase
MPIESGERIGGRYIVESIIAEGGMSYVLLATHEELDELVAIKVMKPVFLSDGELVARFAREAKTTAQIKSDYSVKVHDVGFDSRRGPFIVVEYLEGQTLGDLLTEQGPVAPRRAVEFFIQICDALASAHSRDVVHRDIKPHNIFITKRGTLETAKLLDFGISKAALTGSVLSTDLSVVATTSLLGSPMYMSPEQMRSSKAVDARSDIWSLGVALYESLTGRPPFDSDNVTELCALVLEQLPTPVSTIKPNIDIALSKVVMRCLQREASARYQNVGELAIALMAHAPSRSRTVVESIVNSLASGGIEVALDRRVSAPPPLAPDTARTTAHAATTHSATHADQGSSRARAGYWAIAPAVLGVFGIAIGVYYMRLPARIPVRNAPSSASVVQLPDVLPALASIPSVTTTALQQVAPATSVEFVVTSNARGAHALFRGELHALPLRTIIVAGVARETLEVTAPGYTGKRYWLTLTHASTLDAELKPGQPSVVDAHPSESTLARTRTGTGLLGTAAMRNNAAPRHSNTAHAAGTAPSSTAALPADIRTTR